MEGEKVLKKNDFGKGFGLETPQNPHYTTPIPHENPINTLFENMPTKRKVHLLTTLSLGFLTSCLIDVSAIGVFVLIIFWVVDILTIEL